MTSTSNNNANFMHQFEGESLTDVSFLLCLLWPREAPMMILQVVQAAIFLLEDDSQVGTTLVVHNTGEVYQWKLAKQNMHLVSLKREGL